MADLPILFSAPMVRGLIREVERPGTGKRQTRRILNLGTSLWNTINGADSWARNEWIVALTYTVERRNVDAA